MTPPRWNSMSILLSPVLGSDCSETQRIGPADRPLLLATTVGEPNTLPDLGERLLD
jgi:hypothetical protein